MNARERLAVLASAWVFGAYSGAGGAAQDLMPDIHGLGFSADGGTLLVATHHGLVGYEAGRWRRVEGPRHDLMGFAPTGRALYTSGHPAAGSGLANPLGLMKSTDGGKSWKKLGLEGAADFHLSAASWGTGAILVFSPVANARMPSPGLYVTANDGFMWRRIAAQGLEGGPTSLAVHPTDARTMAVGTQSGLFLSADGGERFRRVAGGGQVTSIAFSADGKSLWYGGYAGKPTLSRIALPAGTETGVALPRLDQDVVSNIAHHPRDPGTHALATFKRNVYLSRDAGKTWRLLAEGGVPK
ncbi:MAG: hypothetical protein Fur0039_17810 [Rhodocyclaceae bacterium]